MWSNNALAAVAFEPKGWQSASFELCSIPSFVCETSSWVAGAGITSTQSSGCSLLVITVDYFEDGLERIGPPYRPYLHLPVWWTIRVSTPDSWSYRDGRAIQKQQVPVSASVGL